MSNENGTSSKGITIAVSVFALAFSSWAFVIKYAADTTNQSLSEQTQLSREIATMQIQLRERLVRLETELQVMQRELDRHNREHERK